jgi:hypothetical protein
VPLGSHAVSRVRYLHGQVAYLALRWHSAERPDASTLVRPAVTLTCHRLQVFFRMVPCSSSACPCVIVILWRPAECLQPPGVVRLTRASCEGRVVRVGVSISCEGQVGSKPGAFIAFSLSSCGLADLTTKIRCEGPGFDTLCSRGVPSNACSGALTHQNTRRIVTCEGLPESRTLATIARGRLVVGPTQPDLE